MKKLMMLVATLAAALLLIAEESYTDVQSEWYSSVSRKREATSVRIGKEYWNASDKDKPLPYRFSCGAVLHSTLGGKRLDLSNVVITEGINADGNLAILLAGNNVVSGGIVLSYLLDNYPLLVFGPGALTVRGGYPGAISSSELSICAGASVTVYDTSGGGWAPVSGSRLSVYMSSLAVFAPEGSGVYSKTINILGSAVSVYAKTSGLGAYESTVVIDGSVVNIFEHPSSNYTDYHTMISCTHSYLSWAKVGGSALQAGQAYFSNSLVKLYSKTARGVAVGDLSFGEGDYYIASGSPYSAISVNNMTIDGGDVQVCASEEDALGVEAINFKIDSGRMELVNKIDIREFLKFDGTAAAVFTGAVAGGVIDSSALMANFYSQVISDAITNGKIGNLEGHAYAGIQCNTYTQNCGTVWCDLPTYGIITDTSPIISGGSCKGEFFEWSWNDQHNVIVPTHVEKDGTKLPLKCVSYAISGASKYDKITQSWDGILPSYYGTGSLYTDEYGKLYFWVPEAWNGGSGGGGGTLPDLRPYTPSEWSAPLVVSASSISTDGATVFSSNDSLYLNWAFICEDADISKTFYTRLYVDDSLVYTWNTTDGLQKEHYTWVKGFSLGRLSVGTHKVQIVADSTGEIAESDESNNAFETTITVTDGRLPNLNAVTATVSKASFPLSESVTVRWRIVNNGDATAGESKIAFFIYDYDSESEELSLAGLEWIDCPRLAAGSGKDFAKTITGAKLGVGIHSFAVYADGEETIAESNEGDNLSAVAVVVTKATGGVSVSFNANGGTVDETVRVVQKGAMLSDLPIPTRIGYVFTGWFTSASGGTQISASTKVTGDVIYYAHWVYDGSIVVRSFEPVAAGGTIRLVLGREGRSTERIAVKVKTQTSTGICGTDFAYVKEVLVWEAGDTSDKVIEIPTYGSGAGKQLRVKLATLTTGAYADCVTPKLAESKVYAEMTTPKPGTITVTAPNPLSVTAGNTLRMTFSRTGGSNGKIAVKAKTQTSTALMGTNGSADFDYVKKTLEWGDGDATDRHIDIPTYVQPWEGVRMLRVKLATLATGAYAGNLTPALAESKIYAEIESPVAFGTVSVASQVANPEAGQPLRLVFRRVGGNDYPIAVKFKVQTSTAVAGTDFEYKKGVVTWGDGESDDKVVEVPTYPSAAGKQLRVKLSTLTQGAYEGCVTPHVKSAKVYVTLR